MVFLIATFIRVCMLSVILLGWGYFLNQDPASLQLIALAGFTTWLLGTYFFQRAGDWIEDTLTRLDRRFS